MDKNKFTVLVNGMGNIGTSLISLLLYYKDELELLKIYACKRSFVPWNKVERDFLTNKGVEICSVEKQSGITHIDSIIEKVDYIFEATENGVGRSNLEKYKKLKNLRGASAQGSEKGFGIPFMSGVNNQQIRNQKFVNVVSCNTHGTAAILKTFAGDQLENLAQADVVVVRRSEDLGNHQRLVSANVVARHLDQDAGTHHSVDVIDMFKTKGIDCKLTSSDITTPSQLMHSVRFNITFKKSLQHKLDDLIFNNPFIATTTKFDSNVVFELGRRYGFHGRIFSHAIILKGNMLKANNTLKGWAFVPQEGNSLLSTLHAYLIQLDFQNQTTELL